MTRKKVNLSLIVNDSARKASLKKRTAGLLKKVSELSTLCGVKTFVIIYSPDDRQPVMWPTRPEVQEILARFYNMPEIERNKKMENQETYLQKKVKKLQEQFIQLQKKNKEMEVSNIMHIVYEGNGIDDLNLTDLRSLVLFADEKRKIIERRLEFCKQTSISLGSPLFAHPPPLHLAATPNQAPMFVPNQMAHNLDEPNHDHHEKAPPESSQCEQWFIDMMNNTDNSAGNSKKAKLNHVVGLNAYYQPFAASSNNGNQLRVMGPENYNSYFGGSSGAETTMSLHPHRDFRSSITTRDTDMPILLSSPPMPLHFGGSNNVNDFSLGLGPRHGGFIAHQGYRESDMNMALPSSHFEGNSSGSDIALSLQPFGNVEIGGSVTSGDMGLPSELFRGNNDTSDVGLRYDIAKQWPNNFNP
ncbi:hypothetical protein Ddye_018787 [Dipteronia dyeriana]|uniref:MADS-box domain-containing protein n=1 Tax=Dipteronia dyeriana TaxID=168575 RepID=A0AAD9UBP8_9ROSI|nr:hypothetical protein Ddye_018787 [Dipteronia dyeriana]